MFSRAVERSETKEQGAYISSARKTRNRGTFLALLARRTSMYERFRRAPFECFGGKKDEKTTCYRGSSTPLAVENIERGKESGERAANNGRQPKHPINLTGPGPQAPRGFKLSHPKHRRRGHNPYITLHSPGKGSHAVCAVAAAWAEGGEGGEG